MSERDRFDGWRVDESSFPAEAPLAERLRFLLRYAVLAPSSHNTQPWRFRVGGQRVDVFVDHSRWLRIADADQRELHLSIGCAVENLLVAAEQFELGHSVAFFPQADDASLAASIEFKDGATRSPCRSKVLFEMIPVRHTNHGRYEPRPIPAEVIEQLQAVCVEEEVRLYLNSDESFKQKADELVVRGDAIAFANPEFRKELAYWIGQGVFGTGWLMSKVGQLAVRYIDMGKSQAKKDSELLMSSPVLGVIATETDGREQQVKAGQVYQRLSLLAASHGIWCQPMSQMVEMEQLKCELASLLPDPGMVPQHPFRMGFAEAEKQHTPRRRLEDVLE